mgnify:CR=1 FL=1
MCAMPARWRERALLLPECFPINLEPYRPDTSVWLCCSRYRHRVHRRVPSTAAMAVVERPVRLPSGPLGRGYELEDWYHYAPSVLDYKLAVSLAPTDEANSMWLDVDATLSRPLHASGLPGARIERLQLEGSSGLLDIIGSQTFIPTAAGGKIRVKLPALSAGERIRLRG